jgi:hypothetical protein
MTVKPVDGRVVVLPILPGGSWFELRPWIGWANEQLVGRIW